MTIKTQIPEKATHFEPARGFWWRSPDVLQAHWARLTEAGWIEDTQPAPHTRFRVDRLDPEQFEHPKTTPVAKAIDALERVGKGLTPVGVKVEINGAICTVVASFTNMHGYELVSVEDSEGQCMCFRADMCSPIRTAEQLEAEERVKAAQVWLKSIELQYGQEIADKCEDILMKAEATKKVKS